MTSLPIVERELGIASRKLGSWLSRWIIAIAAVGFGAIWLGMAYWQGGMMKGDGMQMMMKDSTMMKNMMALALSREKLCVFEVKKKFSRTARKSLRIPTLSSKS